ncbi:MAG: Gfo/Idh/MocA family oxidoreductase [Candidatus Aminicenantales bacterium]
MDKIRVIIYGTGVMGRRIAQELNKKQSFELVGAVDADPQLAGKDLGELFEPPLKSGVIITKDASALLSKVKAEAVVLATTSYLKTVFSQIAQCLEAGINVISTCEELSYPWRREPELAQKIDSLAKTKNVTVTGTGINPGFLMDTLPLVLTAPCLKVKSIKVTRMMDSSKRRLPFQKKIGTGLSQQEFQQKIANKVISGHVGLLESLFMIADTLGWELDEAVELPPTPVIDEKEVKTGLGVIKPGNVIGLTSVAFGRKRGQEVITLKFRANAAVDEEYDEIIIKGEPSIHQRIIGGVHGDTGTVAVTINTIPKVVEASSGLKLMKDLPPACAVS